MPERLVAVDFAERTDPGRDPSKQVNEDSCGYKVTPLGHLAVVCDGMGGHEGGREASTRAVVAIFSAFERGSFEASQTPRGRAGLLKSAIEEANREVFALAPPNVHARPGSTVVAVLLHPHGADVAHVGDSRVYLVHGAQVVQVTRDHSVVEQLVAAGVLTPEQAASHPDANQIVRALGMKQDVEVDVTETPVPFVAGDAFILCSDGMSDLVKPEDMLQIVGTAPAAQVAGQLVDLANARGGHDNITVQVLRARESADAQAAKPLAPTVAEPIAQTVIDAPAAAQDPNRRTYVPPVPAAAAPGTPASRGPVSMEEEEPAPAHKSPAIVIGVVLALVGLVLAVVAIRIATSKNKHHDVSLPIDLDASSLAVPSATLTEPSTVPSAPPVTDAGPLMPLAPATHGHHHGSGTSTAPTTPPVPVPTPTDINL